MGWWNGKEELFENNEIPYNKCTECGDYKEVSKKYINKINDEMITICIEFNEWKKVNKTINEYNKTPTITTKGMKPL